MSKRYTYDDVMDMTEEEFNKLRERHWLASEIANSQISRVAEKTFDNPWFKRELVKKGVTGVIILGSVGIACATAVKIANMFRDDD